jgi:hypothetical protein
LQTRRRRGARARRLPGEIERWEGRKVTRGRGGEQEVGAGDQGWFTAPVIGRQKAEQRGQRRQEEEGEEWNQGLFCKIKETQGLY